jgi:hypothetical protein
MRKVKSPRQIQQAHIIIKMNLISKVSRKNDFLIENLGFEQELQQILLANLKNN